MTFPFPLLPIPGTSGRLNVPMQNPTFWLHKDGSAERATTILEELRCRRMLARRIQEWEYEQVMIAENLAGWAAYVGDPPPVFKGLPQP